MYQQCILNPKLLDIPSELKNPQTRNNCPICQNLGWGTIKSYQRMSIDVASLCPTTSSDTIDTVGDLTGNMKGDMKTEMDGEYKKNGFDNFAFEKGPIDLENASPAKLNGNVNLSTEKEEDPPERDQWGNGIEFLMSCIAMSVGLGNIWRFPFIANRNGGGAFLIPYLIVLTVIGRPLYYMEMALGQFSNRGNIKMYEKLSPVFKGIGYGQLIGVICVATYYCSIMSITLFYLINSFTSNFPWATCQSSWENYTISRNITCVDQYTNVTDIMTDGTISSSELYFKRDVLKEYDNIEDGIGVPEWRLTLLLLAAWAVTFLVSIRGVKSSGKASYFLALFPYVIMIALLVRAATLNGAGDGMYYFIETHWDRLADAEVWYAAVTQCFFSLNVGFGTIIMFSSYNNFKHDINRDALIITTLDTFTSLLSGVTIFGILGNLAYEMNVHPRDVISGGGGTGLAFISYPDAISKFEAVPWLFAILFFLMLFVLGIGSLAALHGAMNTAIKDALPHLANWKISAFTACCSFLIGLAYVTPGGQYVLDLVDHFGGTFVIFLCAILEVIVVTWFYGVDQFCLDLEFMIDKKVGMYWRICWGVLMPGFLIVIFIYFLATLQPLRYGIYNYLYPIGLTAVGWCIVGLAVVQIFMWFIYYLAVNRDSSMTKMFAKTFSTANWEPEGVRRKEDWRKFKENVINARKPAKGNWFCRKLRVLVQK